MEVDPSQLASLDITKPNAARVWVYWLGGKDNFAADRELGDRMLEVYPLAARMARDNRQFLGRAVRYVAEQGIRQFVDIGAGLPTAVNTHQIVQRIWPSAKVAYLDSDLLVIRHAEALLARDPGVIALPGDARDPVAILADPRLNELIDFTAPACVVLSAVLHFLDLDTARKAVATFTRTLASGSYLIASVGTGDAELTTRFAAGYNAASLQIFTAEEFATFFDGLDVAPPGIVPALAWTGGDPVPGLQRQDATFLVAVARKP
jgi:O-methyltransferase involved in polyketide biosynthesis